MEDLWHSRRPPEPLDLDSLLAADANGGSGSAAPAAEGSACKALGLTDAHAVWDVQQNARVFLSAVQAFLDERADELGAAQVGAGCSIGALLSSMRASSSALLSPLPRQGTRVMCRPGWPFEGLLHP